MNFFAGKYFILIAVLLSAQFLSSCMTYEEHRDTTALAGVGNLRDTEERRVWIGSYLFHTNCAECHSLRTDTLISTISLVNLYRFSKDSLDLSMHRILSDSIHLGNARVADTIALLNIEEYIKKSYTPKFN